MQITIHVDDLLVLIGLAGAISFVLGLGLGELVLYFRWQKYQSILDAKEKDSDVA